MANPTNRKRCGFTLIELLVVIVIITILLLLAFPTLNAMRGSRVDAGVNTIGAAAEAARQFATRKITFLKPLPPNGNHGDYSGTAMLFTPANEIRLVENDQTAEDDSGNFLEVYESLGLPSGNPQNLNGYKDIDGRDFITFPRGVGIVGISRGGALGSSTLRLYSPPFALRFDEYGHLISAQSTAAADRLVHYDGNCNDTYDTGADRPNNYDPTAHDPYYGNGTINNAQNKYVVPFEQIRTVVGVIVFDKDALLDSGLTLVHDGTTESLNDNAKDWILENGQAVFFNRYTGAPIRNN